MNDAIQPSRYYCIHCNKDVHPDEVAFAVHKARILRIAEDGRVSVTCVECKARLDGDDARIDLER